MANRVTAPNQFCQSVTKRKVFWFFFYLIFLVSASAKVIITRFTLPLSSVRILTSLMYAPFAAAILWNLLCDIKRPRKNIIAGLYYLFAIYYGCLFVYRLFTHMEVKENFYFSIILFGSLALYQQIWSGRLCITKKDFEENFIMLAMFLIAYRIVYSVAFSKIIKPQPLNAIISTSMLLMLLPLMVSYIHKNSDKSIWVLLSYLGICAGIVLTVTTSSRMLFLLMIITLISLLLLYIGKRRTFRKLLGTVGCSALIVVIMFSLNVGTVRYAVYRECGGLIKTVADYLPDIGPVPDTDVTDTPPAGRPQQDVEVIQQSQAQIQASDTGRVFLVNSGLEQVRANPWFGTGDVMYFDGTYTQSPHNFILETLVCYGVIGLIILGMLFIAIILQMKIFPRKNRDLWIYTGSVILVMFCFFGISFVQMTAYNCIMCSLFFVLLAYYGDTFSLLHKELAVLP